MQKTNEIYYAGGCFWGVEEYFSRIPGVVRTQAGYANGSTEHPTYEEVCRENTGHVETVRVEYDPIQVTLAHLTHKFFEIIDPTSINRQGNDRGVQYRTGIYYTDPAELPALEDVMKEIRDKVGKPVATELLPLKQFFPAEEYHQAYLKKNPGGYCHIPLERMDYSPEQRAPQVEAESYHVPSDSELAGKLSEEQYRMVRGGGTECPFTGKYWNEHRCGIYVDAATGEPLFSSRDKFDSGCGWPSFSKPLDPKVVTEHTDFSHGMRRTEVKSRVGGCHLGHVFEDGPKERGGLRYCINSAALRFIPFEEMEKEGYGIFKVLIL